MKKSLVSNLKAVATILCVVVITGTAVSYPYLTKDTVTFKVTDKGRITGKESGYYLIFTEGETFKNSDGIFYFKFNSSDLYGMIKEGRIYEAKVYGWRTPVFSGYRNIISVRQK